jgi:hypothetical protein
MDDSGHWYIINVQDEAKFNQWVHAVCNGKETNMEFDYARVNGPHTVWFESWLDITIPANAKEVKEAL